MMILAPAGVGACGPSPRLSPDQFSSAQRIADNRGITREMADELAFNSQANAKRAWDEGRFDREVFSVEALQRAGCVRAAHLQCIAGIPGQRVTGITHGAYHPGRQKIYKLI